MKGTGPAEGLARAAAFLTTRVDGGEPLGRSTANQQGFHVRVSFSVSESRRKDLLPSILGRKARLKGSLDGPGSAREPRRSPTVQVPGHASCLASMRLLSARFGPLFLTRPFGTDPDLF